MKKTLLILSAISISACAQPMPQKNARQNRKAPVKKIINKTPVSVKRNNIRKFKSSIIKIFAVRSQPNYNQPWQNYPQRSAIGSGFVIAGNRIMTNAHIVANQSFMLVRKPGLQKKYIAKLEVVGHECDMAILKVEDPEFFKG